MRKLLISAVAALLSLANILTYASNDVPAKNWYPMTQCFDGYLHSDYPIGDCPSGYQTNPTLLATDIVDVDTTHGENNLGNQIELLGYSFGQQAAFGTSSGARVYFRNTSGPGSWQEVANYRALNTQRAWPVLQVVRGIVQVGSLGSMAAGTVMDVEICVNSGTCPTASAVAGVSSILTAAVTVQPGDTYFASLSGNDGTGVKNDITHPYRYFQKYSTGGTTPSGIWSTLQAGDSIVLRGGTWQDNVGFEGRWARVFHTGGSAPTGVVGHGYIKFGAYSSKKCDAGSCSTSDTPAAQEDVHYIDPCIQTTATFSIASTSVTSVGTTVGVTVGMEVNAFTAPSSTPTVSGYVSSFTSNTITLTANAGANGTAITTYVGCGGGIEGVSSAGAASGYGKYFTISGLHIEMSANTGIPIRDAAPVYFQNGADFWRVMDNEIGPWPLNVSCGTCNYATAGGVAGQAANPSIGFNYMHDIGGDRNQQQTHGIYIGDSGGSYNQMSTNWDIGYNWIYNILAGSLIQWNASVVTGAFSGFKVHNNYLDTAAKYGLNFNNEVQSVDATNNIILNSGKPAVRWNDNTASKAINITHNTISQLSSTDAYVCVVANEDGNLTGGTINFAHNIIQTKSANGMAYYCINVGDTAFVAKQNLYYDQSGVLAIPSIDATFGLSGNPKFTNPSVGNYTLAAGSPGINACTQAEAIAISADVYGIARPVTGTSAPSAPYNDIGVSQGAGT